MFLDTFTYFNERELLELRVNSLKDHVSGFIIAEGDRTHRGEPKEYTCAKTIKELGLPEDMIWVVEVKLPSFEEAPDPWIRERGQRDALAKPLQLLPDNTVFLCSDVDELLNCSKLGVLKEKLQANPEKILGLSMSMHYGRADKQLMSPSKELFEWKCGTVTTVKTLKRLGSITEIRAQPNRDFVGCRDAGWHFSWMGDANARRTKLRSIAEYYLYDTDEVRRRCDDFVPTDGNTDMLGRQDHLLTPYPVEDLPHEAVKLERVKKYLLPDV